MSLASPSRRGQPGRRPDFSLESRFSGRIAGVDEAGRGPLAGPVLAAAVVFRQPAPPDLAALIDDSKRLKPAQRQAAYVALRVLEDEGGVEIAAGAASVREIETLNILYASLLAMRRAVLRLPSPPDRALIDGNRAPALACPADCVIGGDGISLSIAAASIVAKVLRDRAMARLHARFPQYGWAGNSGYGTAIHRAALRDRGATPHHRISFGTVRLLANCS